ncbi:DsbA family protein [Pseudoroseicyclus aestuarii]|nr:DsbA family protein [Pseudoroseicyclus aestuarii]
MRIRTSLTALALAIAGAAPLPAAAQQMDFEGMSSAEREAFGAEVRTYLLENPEVLMEAISTLEDRQTQAQAQAVGDAIASNANAIYASETDWTGGNPEGDVTLVEFFDYRCGYCRRAFPEIEELVETDGDIRLVLKEFPILGEQSVLASRFAIAVRQLHGDEAYKDTHDALLTMRGDVGEASLSQLAEALDLDPAPILEAMTGDEVTEVIEANYALGQALQINGTPSFIMGDQLIGGYLPLGQMQALVDQTRED